MQDQITHMLRRTAIATVALLMGLSMVATAPLFGQIQDTTDTTEMDTGMTADTSDVVSALSQQPDFSQISEALQQTGLDQELDQASAYTLFAPTDSALAMLETPLSEMSEAESVEILRNHVVLDQELMPDSLTQMTEVQMVSGEILQVTPQTGGQVTVGDANVNLYEPIDTQNGIIYGVDAVLMPAPMGAE